MQNSLRFIHSFLLLLVLFGSFTVHGKDLKVFTTQTLVQDLEKMPPEVAFFFNPAGPLNRYNGVIGSLGTLGRFSPYGSNPWNATPYMRGLGNWEELQRTLTRMGGPLSENGPHILMTEFGQNFLNLFSESFPGTVPSNLFKSLRAGSPLHILGDAGPLGALSVMGPGGPNGASGLGQTAQGDFVNEAGELQHSMDIMTRDGEWNAPLYELYQGKENRFNSPDSFFGLEGSLTRSNAKKTVSFTNNRNQMVSILLISDYTLDDMELTLRAKGSKKKIAATRHPTLSNFIVFEAPAFTEFEVDVELKSSLHMLPNKSFRLYVTGSSEKAKVFKGAHQRTFSSSLLRYSKAIKSAFKSMGCHEIMMGLIP